MLHFGLIWAQFGAFWRKFGAFWGLLGHLEPFWSHLESIWGYSGRAQTPVSVETRLTSLGPVYPLAIDTSSWDSLGFPGGPPPPDFGAILTIFDHFWAIFGPFWGRKKNTFFSRFLAFWPRYKAAANVATWQNFYSTPPPGGGATFID